MTDGDVVVSGKELAALIGCRPSYVTQLKQQQRLVPADDGKGYWKAASLALYRQTGDPAYAGVAARHAQARGAVLAVEGGDHDDYVEPATPDAKRKAKALADKAEVDAKAALRDYEVSMGKLLDAGEVEQALSEAAVALRVALERMADTLAPQLAATADEMRCRSLVWDEVSHALEELSRGFRSIAKMQQVAA